MHFDYPKTYFVTQTVWCQAAQSHLGRLEQQSIGNEIFASKTRCIKGTPCFLSPYITCYPQHPTYPTYPAYQ